MSIRQFNSYSRVLVLSFLSVSELTLPIVARVQQIIIKVNRVGIGHRAEADANAFLTVRVPTSKDHPCFWPTDEFLP